MKKKELCFSRIKNDEIMDVKKLKDKLEQVNFALMNQNGQGGNHQIIRIQYALIGGYSIKNFKKSAGDWSYRIEEIRQDTYQLFIEREIMTDCDMDLEERIAYDFSIILENLKGEEVSFEVVYAASQTKKLRLIQ